MSDKNFKFIDLPSSAERLGVTRTQLLQWVDEGRIRPFSGKGQQSVFRASDVGRFALELGVGTATATAQAEAGEPEAQSATPPARVRRRDPVKLIGTRLSMDSRWAEISDQDIAVWLDATEPVQFDRVRKVADLAIERLQKLRSMLDEKA